MNDTFKGFCLHGTERFNQGEPFAVDKNASVTEREIPELNEGEVLVRPLFTSICGSDVSACLGKPNFDWIQRPRIIGHETCAEIVRFHPDYQGDFKPGDLVVPVAQLGCRKVDCPACRNGKWNLCPDKTILGYHRDGAFGEMMTLETDRLVPLTGGLLPLYGALVEPLSVVVNALYSKCSVKPGMNVLVTGCGIMGLFAAELARAAGAEVAVTGLERDANVRLRIVEERGFAPIKVSAKNPLLPQLANGARNRYGKIFGDKGKVDMLIECTGSPQVLAEALYAVKPEHDVCLISTYPQHVELDATHITRQSLNLKGVMGSNKEHFFIAMDLLSSGKIMPLYFINLYSFENIKLAFAESVTARNIKAIIEIHHNAAYEAAYEAELQSTPIPGFDPDQEFDPETEWDSEPKWEMESESESEWELSI